MGPVFVKEPPNRVDFSNGTGAVIECQARGNPNPDIIWVRSDGSAVGDVPGLRQVSEFLLETVIYSLTLRYINYFFRSYLMGI